MTRRILAPLAVAVALLLGAGSAQAITINVYGPQGEAPVTAEDAFLATLAPGYVTESFESFILPVPGSGPGGRGGLMSPLTVDGYVFDTAVGGFKQAAPPYYLTGQACDPVCGQGLVILSPSTTPYGGRFPIQNAAEGDNGSQWLDTNDAASVEFTLEPVKTAVGFYLTDINDVGGQLRITAFDGGSMSYLFGGGYGAVNYSYVTITDPSGIRSVDFTVIGNVNDGFGIDRVTIGDPVPEPGTLLLLGGGLLGLVARARRRKA